MAHNCESQNKTRDNVLKAIIFNLMENGPMMIADLATAAG